MIVVVLSTLDAADCELCYCSCCARHFSNTFIMATFFFCN